MDLSRTYKQEEGLTTLLKPGEKSMRLIEFGIISLKDGQTFRSGTRENEAVIVILSGKCNVTSPEREWKSVGERESVFEGRPHSAYIPSNSEYAVTGLGDVEAALCMAPAKPGREARLIPPADGNVLSRGRGNWYRDVFEIAALGENTESLIVGETISRPGNWCSYPPHRHELEEMYFFKVNPPQGFGIQRVYTDDKKLDELHAIRNNSLVAIPTGYHPLVAAPGYSIWFLYVLAAAQGRLLEPYSDPDHIWLDDSKGEET